MTRSTIPPGRYIATTVKINAARTTSACRITLVLWLTQSSWGTEAAIAAISSTTVSLAKVVTSPS